VGGFGIIAACIVNVDDGVEYPIILTASTLN
jgi:hypothetical protein